MDTHGHYVRQGTDPLGGAFATGYRSAGGPDFPFCRGRPLGPAVCPGHHDDLHLHDPGGHGNPCRHEIQACGRGQISG